MSDEEQAPPEQGDGAADVTAEATEQALAPFLNRHKSSTIATRPNDGKISVILERPWDDPTLILNITRLEEAQLALNNVLLPKRLTAVWHLDSSDLEVIWTAYRLSDDQQEIAGRTFNFTYKEEAYLCEFGLSSDRLLAIAKMSQPNSNPSDTQFRNLTSFFVHQTAAVGSDRRISLDQPRSFWIRNVKLSEKNIIPLLERLNFYLSYYDERSPIVSIHGEGDAFAHQRTRYPTGGFPNSIFSRNLDSNLISFWEAARRENELLQFILYYRIIEYAGFHYVDVEVREAVLRILRDPTRGQDGTRALQAILQALDPTKMGGDERFTALLERHVPAETVWREIDLNRAIFAKEQEFDGGFTLEPLIGKREALAGFSTGGMIRFATALRKIRNVLAHGRDQKTGTVITPSLRNLRMLRPWVAAIAAAAGEVVMYEPAP